MVLISDRHGLGLFLGKVSGIAKCYAMVEDSLYRHSLLMNTLDLQSLKTNIPLPVTTHNLGFGTCSAKFPSCLCRRARQGCSLDPGLSLLQPGEPLVHVWILFK